MRPAIEPNKISVTARAPFNVYFEGLANSVTAINKVGQFDILPGHADFFSIINPGEVLIETGAEPVSFMVKNGIVTVRDNEVYLFVNI